MPAQEFDSLPNIYDGLSRKERVVLYCLKEAQKERGDRYIPTAMLYGRVLEHIKLSEKELQIILQKHQSL